MWEKSLLRPELIYSTISAYSGTINVRQQGKERTLTVEKYPQSVNLDAHNLENRVWGKLVEESTKRISDPKAALILGLGGGTVAHLLSKRFPKLVIDGVEIDPVIVEVGERFFKLKEIPNLRVIIADAVDVCRHPKHYSLSVPRYSLVVSDVYRGDCAPSGMWKGETLQGISKLLSPEGIAAFNLVVRSAPDRFQSELEGVFGSVEEIGVTPNWGLPPGNILYLCS